MSRTSGVLPRHAQLPFLISLLGRFGYAGHGLAVLLFLNQSVGSLAVAGTLDAVFAFTATSTVPLRARLMDRRGAGTPVLPVLGIAYGAAVCALLVMGSWAPPVLLAVPLAAMGLSAPPMGVVMRILWAALVPEELLGRALGRDAVAEELSVVCGPLLGGLAAASASPRTAVVLTGALITGAALPLGRAATRHLPASNATATAAAPGAGSGAAKGGSVVFRLRPVLAVLGSLGVLLGTVELAAVAVPGVAALPGGAGCLLALMSAGSAIGAVIQGRLPDPAAPLRRALLLTTGAVLLAGLLLGALSLRSPLWWAVGLPVVGGCVSPAIVAGYLWVARTAREHPAEANAWANTALGMGVAVGTALAGMALGLA
ncbi:MFS transporter [Streptomyces sp. NPDC059373]